MQNRHLAKLLWTYTHTHTQRNIFDQDSLSSWLIHKSSWTINLLQLKHAAICCFPCKSFCILHQPSGMTPWVYFCVLSLWSFTYGWVKYFIAHNTLPSETRSGYFYKHFQVQQVLLHVHIIPDTGSTGKKEENICCVFNLTLFASLRDCACFS